MLADPVYNVRQIQKNEHEADEVLRTDDMMDLVLFYYNVMGAERPLHLLCTRCSLGHATSRL